VSEPAEGFEPPTH